MDPIHHRIPVANSSLQGALVRVRPTALLAAEPEGLRGCDLCATEIRNHRNLWTEKNSMAFKLKMLKHSKNGATNQKYHGCNNNNGAPILPISLPVSMLQHAATPISGWAFRSRRMDKSAPQGRWTQRSQGLQRFRDTRCI